MGLKKILKKGFAKFEEYNRPENIEKRLKNKLTQKRLLDKIEILEEKRRKRKKKKLKHIKIGY